MYLADTQHVLQSATPCPAPHPCVCTGSLIDCSGKGLLHVPVISHGGQQSWTVDISHNQLATIPERAFGNISVVSFNISFNQLSDMPMDCLAGSESKVLSVHMESNQFSYLPNAIDDLTNLSALSIQDNPLIMLGSGMSFGASLRNLTLGSSDFVPWPKYIDQLNTVTHLKILNLSCGSLPFDAFDNMADTLTSLLLYNNGCGNVIECVRVATKLEQLTYVDNKPLTSSNIRTLTSLTSLYIKNSSLTTVPDVSRSRNLQTIHLTYSPVDTWDQHALPSHSVLRNITLDYTKFDHIPHVLRQIPTLEATSMVRTYVSSVEDDDFANLPQLKYLDLSGSLLANMSDAAFQNNAKLYELNIAHTRLFGVPRAIENVGSLYVLNMTSVIFDCTCFDLGWMRSWRALEHSVTITGDCDNVGVDLITYIRNYLPKCP